MNTKALSAMALLAMSVVASAQVTYTIQTIGPVEIPGFPLVEVTRAKAINSSGQVAGESVSYDENGEFAQSRGVRWQNGVSTSLDVLGSSENSNVTDINDSGVVVGYSFGQATYWSGTTANSLGLLDGGTYSLAWGINNSGQVIGSADDSNGQERMVIFDIAGGAPTILTIPTSNYNIGWAIGNGGHVVGEWSPNASGINYQAFVAQGSTITNLGYLAGGTRSTAQAVNCFGVAVGYGNSSVGERGWISTSSGLQSLGVLSGFTSSRAWGINDSGHVVGTLGGGSIQRAFLHDGATMVDLNTLLDPSVSGWELLEAYDINEAGQIVGVGRINGEFRGFVLTPVPEPATMTLLALAALLKRRRAAKKS